MLLWSRVFLKYLCFLFTMSSYLTLLNKTFSIHSVKNMIVLLDIECPDHRTPPENVIVTNDECVRILEVRQEAVQQALAAMQSRPKPSLPMPSKRTSVMARSPDRAAATRNDTGKCDRLLFCAFCRLIRCIFYASKTFQNIFKRK